METKEKNSSFKELLYTCRWYIVNKLEPGTMQNMLFQLVSLLIGDGREVHDLRPFEPEAPKPSPDHGDHGLHLCFIRGHTANSGGAYGVSPINASEYVFYRDQVEPRLKKYCDRLGVKSLFVTRDGHGMGGAARTANNWAKGKTKRTIELHFNAANKTASGTCTLYDTREPRNRLFAEEIQEAMVGVMKLRDRGLIKRDTGRGAYNLKAVDHTSCLIEPFFGDNREDAKRAVGNIDALAKALVLASVNSAKREKNLKS